MTQRSPVVLITGVSSGIGRAVADVFAAKGFEVFGTSRNPRTTNPVPGVELVQLDVADDASVAAAVSTVIQRAGRIDILVNNAGVGVFGAAEESSIAQAQELFDTNFFGVIRLTREVLPHLRAQGSGRIINVGSVVGFLHETREFGERVSVVEPVYTSTSFVANATDANAPIESHAPLRELVKAGLRK